MNISDGLTGHDRMQSRLDYLADNQGLGLTTRQRGQVVGTLDSKSCELTILMPCLNEAETIETCVRKAQSFFASAGLVGEVLVADNGSTDGSQEIARGLGARVISVSEPGYGSALIGGISSARGHYVIMGDADDSYDFEHLDQFVKELRDGFDLVMGNRFRGGIEKGAMPLLHRYIGNPILSLLGRVFYRIPVGDFHCGLRGFKRQSILDLRLKTTGMEFASEMVVRASLAGFKIHEVPTTLSPDGRSGPPHLRTWRDGWRHLSFLLMYSPKWLFLYPGLLLLVAGVLGVAVLLPGPIMIGGVTFDIHTFTMSCLLVLLGTQAIQFAVTARRFAVSQKLMPPPRRYLSLFEGITLQRVLVGAAILLVLGAVGIAYAFVQWVFVGFGPLNYPSLLRILILSATAFAIGMQSAFIAFLSAIMEVPTK